MLAEDKYIALYRSLLLPRVIEERMLVLLRQGKVAKWFSGMGQEAVSVGVTSAIEQSDFLFPLIRNVGAFTTRGVPLEKLFCQFFGKAGGYTNARDRTFHFTSLEHRIIGNPTLLVAQLPVAAGVALGVRMRKQNAVAVSFCGDGGTSEGDFHEALNVASVWDLPVLFVVENNQYALSTPSSEQYRCEKLSDRALGYGIGGRTIDGNDVLEVYNTVSEIVAGMRQNPRPFLLECKTFRMRGHEEASGIKYVPPELLAEWGEKDPIKRFEQVLAEKGLLDEALKSQILAELQGQVLSAVDAALEAPEVQSSPDAELNAVFAPAPAESGVSVAVGSSAQGGAAHSGVQPPKNLRLVDAVADGLSTAMRSNPDVVLMGQDIAGYGGVFKVTDGMLEEFGSLRVRNTPLCESAVIGAAMGLTLAGYRPVVEMQFADFVSCGINQIYNNLSKQHYRTGLPVPMVIRLPTGAGIGGGPYHSDSNEAWFMHIPGLKLAYPSTPADAKGMLLAAIEDPNPVLFFEHKWLYRTVSGEVPAGYYTVALGKARVVQPGSDVTIVTYGAGVHWALEAAQQLPGISLYILDLRSLAPLDFTAIEEAVAATGKAIVLTEARMTCGAGAEIAALIAKRCFASLDAPVERVANLDTPVPFAGQLEALYLGNARLKDAIISLVEY